VLIELDIHFRLAIEDDLPALEWMGLFTRQREIIAGAFEAQQEGDGAMLFAIAGEFPIGQAWLDFAPEHPRIWAVRIFPPLQGAGLGGALMAEAEALAEARGADAVEVGVEWDNAGARRFYDRLGYRPVGAARERVDYAFEGYDMVMDIDQQILRKELAGR
jgi:ribosomal protein S18 acetylase RimI-like enzyme